MGANPLIKFPKSIGKHRGTSSILMPTILELDVQVSVETIMNRHLQLKYTYLGASFSKTVNTNLPLPNLPSSAKLLPVCTQEMVDWPNHLCIDTLFSPCAALFVIYIYMCERMLALIQPEKNWKWMDGWRTNQCYPSS